MSVMSRATHLLLHNPYQFLDSTIKNLGFLFPDKLYLTLRYRCLMGKWIDWKNPVTYTEKIQWLKIYDYKPEYTTIVDKLAVKDVVAEKIGAEYVIPTLAVYENTTEIDWNRLPNQFVLKTTHGGGGTGVVVCCDKSKFDKANSIEKLNLSMACVVGKQFRERPYYNVPKKIIAEKFIKPEHEELKDYKFFCSDGKVICFKVDFGRFSEHHANYYSTKGELLPFGEVGLEPDLNHNEALPFNLQVMVEIAEKLSKGYKFLRVDLYNVNGMIYFGELTLYPAGGIGPLTSYDWDVKIGEQINIGV